MYSGTTGDVFCECLVHRKKDSSDIIKQVLLIVAAIVLTLVLFLFATPFVIFAAAGWALAVFLIKMLNKEYEYIFTSGELDIDLISGAYKRKRANTISMDTVDIVAPEGSDRLGSFTGGNMKSLDYSANDPQMKNYVIIGSVNNERVQVLFTPNDKMIRNMYEYSPRKVVRDR